MIEVEKMTEGWHLDKKVPIAIIFALIMQCVTLIVFGAKLDSRVSYLEVAGGNRQVLIDNLQTTTSNVNVQLARIQERQAVQIDDIKEIKELVRAEHKP